LGQNDLNNGGYKKDANIPQKVVKRYLNALLSGNVIGDTPLWPMWVYAASKWYLVF